VHVLDVASFFVFDHDLLPNTQRRENVAHFPVKLVVVSVGITVLALMADQ
jgi:hypothetical protein